MLPLLHVAYLEQHRFVLVRRAERHAKVAAAGVRHRHGELVHAQHGGLATARLHTKAPTALYAEYEQDSI